MKARLSDPPAFPHPRPAPTFPDEAAFLLDRLAELQSWLLRRVNAFGPVDFRRRAHKDLSPPGWHLGHCVYVESHWLSRMGVDFPRLAGDAPAWREILMPEKASIEERGSNLPDLPTLIDWARREQHRHLAVLRRLLAKRPEHRLARDDYLLHFLTQHYAQHHETLRRIENFHSPPPSVPLSIDENHKPADDALETLPLGEHRYGADREHHPYDNEHLSGTAICGGVRVKRRPVSNKDYLAFIHDDGYTNPRYWSVESWRWRNENHITAPAHWELRGGRYRARPYSRAIPLDSQAVCGISWHEASAYASWAGGRLPHEREWEAASRLKLLQGTGQVWEWCHNPFHPYPGFQPFPYKGYSTPYFDNRHFTLRGGSWATLTELRRHSFRNYYLPEIRSVFSGLRLVYD